MVFFLGILRLAIVYIYEVISMRKGRIIFLGFVFIFLLDLIFVKWYCDDKINMVEVPVATMDIAERTKIDESMIEYIFVPAAYVRDYAFKNSDEIIGKYTDLGGSITKGSLFYHSALFYEDDLPDAPSLKLKKGQTAFSLPVDLVKLSGNTITEGQKVDVYVTIDQAKGTPAVDNLIRAVRVLDVKDRNGIDIDDEASSHVPYVAILAIDDELINYVKVAERIGMIDILAPSTDYENDQESMLNEHSSVLYLLK